jgi:hypothetical protein
MDNAATPQPGPNVRRAVQWLRVFLLGVLVVALLFSVVIVVQGLLLISSSVAGGLALMLVGVLFGAGVLWRIKVKWAQFRCLAGTKVDHQRKP